MRQLSPMDSMFLFLENQGIYAHGTFVWLYDAADCEEGSISRKALLDTMRDRVGRSQVFQQKVYRLPYDFDHPYWITDDGFELLYHVREQSLPSNSTWKDFCDLISEVHSKPLDQTHPLWEMTLVRNLDGLENCPASCFAILAKFHHAAIDGATGMNIISRIHDDSPDFPVVAQKPARPPGLLESMFRATARNVGSVNKLLEVVGAQANNTKKKEIPEKKTEQKEKLPQAFFNDKVSEERVYDLRRFDMAEIKKLRSLVDSATINDVLLCICAGGLRHYMMDQDELPKNSLVAGCPVNIRTEEEAEAEGNFISAITVSMHTNIADPVERLSFIAESSKQAKQGLSAAGQRKVTDLVSLIPAQTQAMLGFVAGQVVDRLDQAFQFNAPVSNLPGPQQELRLLGARLTDIGAAMPVMNGYGMFLGLCTRGDSLTISTTSSASVLPDASLLGDGFDRAFSAMQAAVQEKKI